MANLTTSYSGDDDAGSENSGAVDFAMTPSSAINGGYDDDDENDDEVMRLAARLAPAFEEANELFQAATTGSQDEKAGVTGSHTGATSAGNETELDSYELYGAASLAEDDDLKREISDLEHSEQLLRQELEHANFFSSFFGGSGGTSGDYDMETDNQEYVHEDYEAQDEPEPDMGPASEADIEQEYFDVPEARLDLPPMAEADGVSSPYNSSHQRSSTPATPQSSSKVPDEGFASPTAKSPKSRATKSPATASSVLSSSDASAVNVPLLVMGKTAVPYDLSDHRESLEIIVQNGWYLADMNRFTLPKSLQPFASHLPSVLDFCISCPENRLKTWYIGFTETTAEEKQYLPSILPVRTSLITIRPDVLVGAVMDALVSASASLVDTQPGRVRDHSILRRQGGHLRMLITTSTTAMPAADATSNDNNAKNEIEFLVDAQLCTQKSHRCERILIVRIFHYSSTIAPPSSDPTSPGGKSPRKQSPHRFSMHHEEDTTPQSCRHLQESCALVQRIEIEATNATSSSRRAIKFRSGQSPSMTDRDAMSAAFSKHLQRTYKACPSVKDKNITLPALNSDDWQLLKDSSVWSDAVWEELDSRCLTFSSLATTRFGAFPCLPTLDVHFCSQIRRYSRETMITQLLNYATQLEEYARDAEYACANVIALLKKTYVQYGVDPPPLPSPIPLTSYPLEYAAPQAICPPWGLQVMEALNNVQAWVDEGQKPDSKRFSTNQEFNPFGEESRAMVVDSTQLAIRSVSAVVQAFQKQDDEEKNSRLERKNNQVMDRLAFMKKHQMVSIQLLDTCTSDMAQLAADELKSKSKIREVPLLKWNVVARNSTGTCIVTARHIIFITQNIPLLGSMGFGQKCTKFNFKHDIDSFEIQENTTGILGVLSISIQLMDTDGREIFSFRPSTGGLRLKNFLDIVLGIARENQSILSS